MRNLTGLTPISILLIFILGGVSGCRQPPPRIGKIVGSSMSPTLRGAHYLVDCPGCGIQFGCDLEQADKRDSAICANCGTHANRDRWTSKDPDPVTVVPHSEIQRWDIIAFQRRPSSDSTLNHGLMTKRVVGLPGESIHFKKGNLFANGALIQKPLQLQKQMRVLVCDSKFQSCPSLNWVLTPEDNWEFANETFQLRSPPITGQFDWFDFRYQKNYFRSDDQQLESALEDFYGYNQSLSRKLNPMDEVFVELNTRINDGVLAWRFGNQSEQFEFQINGPMSEIQIFGGNPKKMPRKKLYKALISPTLQINLSTKIEFSSFDRILRVVVNDTELWTHSLNHVTDELEQTILSFGANRVGVQFDRIRIWRDLYYFDSSEPRGEPNSEATTNAGFFVVGDNIPLSHDSRHWKEPRVAIESVKGKVFSQ